MSLSNIYVERQGRAWDGTPRTCRCHLVTLLAVTMRSPTQEAGGWLANHPSCSPSPGVCSFFSPTFSFQALARAWAYFPWTLWALSLSLKVSLPSNTWPLTEDMAVSLFFPISCQLPRFISCLPRFFSQTLIKASLSLKNPNLSTACPSSRSDFRWRGSFCAYYRTSCARTTQSLLFCWCCVLSRILSIFLLLWWFLSAHECSIAETHHQLLAHTPVNEELEHGQL